MFGPLFIIIGLALLGVSIYSLYGGNLFGSTAESESTSLTSITESGSLTEPYSYDPMPEPVSYKPILIILAVGSFFAALLLLYYLMNFADTTTSKAWIVILLGSCLFLGGILVNMFRSADDKMLKKQEQITSINEQLAQQQKQKVEYAYRVAEEEKKAQLRQIDLIRERKNQEILASLHTKGMRLGIPLERLAGLNEEKLRAEIQIVMNIKEREHETQEEHIRGINKEKVKGFGDRQKISNISRVQYDTLSTKLIKEIGDLQEKIEIVKADKEISKPIKKVRIGSLQKDIENKEFQLNDLRTGLVTSDDREEGKRLNS